MSRGLGDVYKRQGYTIGAAASAGLADATSDAVPYLLLCVICAATLLVLVRVRPRSLQLT